MNKKYINKINKFNYWMDKSKKRNKNSRDFKKDNNILMINKKNKFKIMKIFINYYHKKYNN
jgi:hypothetical protein